MRGCYSRFLSFLYGLFFPFQIFLPVTLSQEGMARLFCFIVLMFCFVIFNKFSYLFILFLSVLGLLCGAQASHCGGFSHCEARDLRVRASVVVEHGLSSCSTQAQLLHGMWDPSGPGLEPVSPALAGGFLTTAPPGKPTLMFLKTLFLEKSPKEKKKIFCI